MDLARFTQHRLNGKVVDIYITRKYTLAYSKISLLQKKIIWSYFTVIQCIQQLFQSLQVFQTITQPEIPVFKLLRFQRETCSSEYSQSKPYSVLAGHTANGKNNK